MDGAARRDASEIRDSETPGKVGARNELQSAQRGEAARAARSRELRLGERARRRRAAEIAPSRRSGGRPSEKVG